VKPDKTFFCLVLLFLTVLSEYPLLFPGQPIYDQPMISPVIFPAMIPESQTPQMTDNSTSAVPVILQTCDPLPLTKTLKDTTLRFAVNVPEDWNASVGWDTGYGSWMGFYYYTYLGPEEKNYNQTGHTSRINSTRITIMTYAITRNQDQDYRNYYRENWDPAPVESVETINGITFNRFESKGRGTAVSYVVQKADANEKGYASLIWYYVSPSECQEDIEQVVHTFRYLNSREISLGNVPGIEISISYP
jgi:hypothetical protein